MRHIAKSIEGATRPALAICAAIFVSAAGVGDAIAISPTMDGPIKWAGGVEFSKNGVAGIESLYVVPAGKNFMLTDLIVSNVHTSGQHTYFDIFSGSTVGCVGDKYRLRTVAVPAFDSKVISLTTGIGFTAGQHVCITAYAPLQVNMRGYLFTPAAAN